MSLLSPSDIKKQFVQIFDKIQNTTTKDVSYDIYKKLILKSTFNENQMMYIIQQVNDFLLSFTKTPKEKEHALKLLALTFYQPETLSQIEKQNTKIYQYKYIPSILTIIQSLINDSNSNLFQSLSSSFADIIQLILPTDIEVSEIEMEIDEKRVYEMIQNFCFQNMASDDKSTRLMGSMFLTRLVENCPIVLQEHYMQGIWDCIVGYLEKNNFHAKYELLNCLISLILGAEGKFKPFANITLCKVFEFLTDNDWLKRKLALNVIYTIIHYCSEEIYEVKEQLIAFLKLLKGDKVKEVRDICLLILDVLNNKEGEYNVNGGSKNKKGNNHNNKKILSSSSSNPNIKQVQYVEKNSNNNVKTKNRKGSLKKNDITTRQSKLNKRNINNNNNINSKEFILVEKHQETSVTSNVNDISNDNVNITTQKSMESVSIRKRSITPTRRTMNNVNNDGNCVINDGNELNTSTNRVVHTSGTSLRNNINKVNVNRKEDKTFVNEKMVIKHDPNRSVFKTGKNAAFFNKAKTQPDIVVLDKPKKEDVIMYIGDDDDNNNDKDDNVNDDNDGNDGSNINNIEIEIKDNNDKKHDEEVNVEKYLIVKQQQQNEEVKHDVSDNENENDNKILSPTFTNVSDSSNNNNNTVKKKVNETTTVYSKKRTNNNNINKPIQQESQNNNNNKTKPSQTQNLNNNNNITSTPNNNNNSNSNNGYSVELINKLLFQMNSLSSKQLLLLETLDTLQSQTMSEISTLNSNIQSLSSTVSSLSTQLSNYQQSNSKPSQDTTNEAFKHALTSHNEQPLLDLIKQTPMNKYGDVEITYLEKAILKLISTLSNGSNIKHILSFYKNIILCLKCPLKQTTIQNVKEILEYLLQHNDSYYHLNDDFLVDISLLLSNIDDNNK